ncbi:MAG: hypothetical protein IJM36_05045 [Acholeplasmatales bacterium]|nr:hypothetical protein [Acholeplasmatales bacterium]
MIKTLKKIFAIITLLFLCGCSKSNKTYSLLDIPKYKNIDISATEEIRVEWDICESQPVIFSIYNEKEIREIIDELCKKDTFIKSKEIRDGGLSRIILINNDKKETTVSLFSIYDKNTKYYYSNDNVYKKVYSIGKESGYLK